MNDTTIIIDTIEKMGCRKLLKFGNLRFGLDSSDTPSVWIYFIVDKNNEDQTKLIKYINAYSNNLKKDLLKNGIDSWPYINFHALQ